MKWILILIIAFTSSMEIAFAEEAFDKKNRIKYIDSSLQALKEEEPKTVLDVYQYITYINRTMCRSSIESLKINCLLSAAKSNCREKSSDLLKKRCNFYSDIIVINKLSEKKFISRRERYRMMKHSKGYRKTLLKELNRRYASVATDFSLTKRSKCGHDDFSCLAKGINQFCIGYADFKDLSWQYCVGALTWFIGTTKKIEE